MADGKNVVPDVWETLDKIKGFSEKVQTWNAHSGLWNESTMGQHSAGRHMLQDLLLTLDTAEIISHKGSSQMRSDLLPRLVHTSQLSRDIEDCSTF